MKKMSTLKSTLMAVGLMASAMIVDGWLPVGLAIKDAEARVGRPATPRSVAGMSRRTTRRTIRRTSVAIAALPRGCRTVVIEGTSLHHCGGTYYQPSGGKYVVVKVD